MRAWGKGRGLELRMDGGDKEGPSCGRAPAWGVGEGCRGEGRGGLGPGGTAPRLRTGVGPEGSSGWVHSEQLSAETFRTGLLGNNFLPGHCITCFLAERPK